MSRRERIRARVSAVARRWWAGGSEEASVVAPPVVAPSVTPPRVDEPAPSFAEAADLWAIRFAVDPQGRPLVVNHWATWCDGCLEEIPALVGLHRAWGDRVPFVGVGWELLSGGEVGPAVDAVSAAHRDHGMPWRTLVYTGTAEDLFSGLELTSEQIPQTFVFDGEGAVRFWHLGALGEREVEAIEALLATLTGG
jgi:cytochrome c biogenesis protein CcmG/thiol:disulfide interchange protein DsbE